MSEIQTQFVTIEDESHTFLEIYFEKFSCEVVNREGELFCLIYEGNDMHKIPLLPFLDALNKGKEALSD